MNKSSSPAKVMSTILVQLFVLMLVLTPIPGYSEEGTTPGLPDANAIPHKIFMPIVHGGLSLTSVAIQTVATQTGLPVDQLQLSDSTEIIFPTIEMMAYVFTIGVIQSDEIHVVTLDAYGTVIDRSAFDAAEAAAYAALGDYEVSSATDNPTDILSDEWVEAAALGSTYVPYIDKKHEYRVSTQSLKCLSGGVIGMKLAPQSNKTANAKLRVILEKCDGSSFLKGGDWWVLVDGIERYKLTRFAPGQKSYAADISPLSQSWYDTKDAHTYQIKMTSLGESSPKYSGKIVGEVWGQCWCTDYAYQKLRLKFAGYLDAANWGPMLVGNGYRKLTTSDNDPRFPLELPKVGDVVVMQLGFPDVGGSAGHVGIIEEFNGQTWTISKLRQGGKVTTGWSPDAYCYNARTETGFTASIKNNRYVQVYRK